jgi:hypothetical protein
MGIIIVSIIGNFGLFRNTKFADIMIVSAINTADARATGYISTPRYETATARKLQLDKEEFPA